MNSNNIPYGYNIKDIHKFNTNNKHLNTKEILYVRQITDDEYEKLINKKSNPDALKLLDYVENILTWTFYLVIYSKINVTFCHFFIVDN